MTLNIMTGMWGPKREQYAAIFLDSFERHWPKEVALQLFSDGDIPGWEKSRAHVRLIGFTDGYLEFLDRHGESALYTGRQPNASWKEKPRRDGYNFRYDAVRFAGQAFIPEAAARDLPDGDVLCWLDADVVTHGAVPAGWIEGLLGDSDGAYLGRGAKHSEIGFWAVRLNPGTRAFLQVFADLYRSDALFELSEWHSAFAWDFARRASGAQLRDLTPGGSGHVWHQSPLRDYTDHLKGERKAKGRSPERRR